jgi:hypothetical protein
MEESEMESLGRVDSCKYIYMRGERISGEDRATCHLCRQHHALQGVRLGMRATYV